MKLLKLSYTLLIITLSTGIAYASDPETRTQSEAEKVTDNNPNVDASKFLSPQYRSSSGNSVNQRLRIRDDDDFKEPMKMREVENLSHPYFKDIMNQIEGLDLEELAALTEDSRFNRLRLDSIYNEALRFGTQTAFYEVIYEFNKDLEDIGDHYDRLFDFNSLMLANGRIRPPVIQVMGDSVERENDRTLRRVRTRVETVRQAAVVTRPPNYIDYLNFTPLTPNPPTKYLLPRPNVEEEISEWREGVREGWILGVRQASNIINEGLYRLLRDFHGMAEFHMAHAQGMISMPEYSDMNIGIVTDGEVLHIGEEIFSIQVLPELNSDAENWEPLPRIDSFLKINW